MADPPFSDFENDLHDTADPIFRAGRTGYAWGPVDELLIDELELEGQVRCKKATGSGRAANVLTESNDKIIELYLVFIGHNYSRQAFLTAAADRIKRFPNVRTVAIADQGSNGKWRVRSIIEREGVGLAEQIKASFPAVTDDDIHEVETDFDGDDVPPGSGPPPAVPAADPEEFESAMLDYEVKLDGLADLPAAFVEFAGERRVVIDLTAAIDMLACVLSSQLVLFAGPSGTGKSRSARLLQQFFAEQEKAQIFEARRQWLSPDDLVGYYSVLADQFATTPDTDKLIELHEASTAPVIAGEDVEGPPVVLVEEINLSAPEGYLAPVIHGLSDVSTPFISWHLHSRATGAVDESAILTLPETAMIGPYPRVFGTINVDATAHAPARKVAARSSVILLEPEPLTESELSNLIDAATDTDPSTETGVAAEYLGDPLAALRAVDDDSADELSKSLVAISGQLGGALISRRDALRSLAYMAYFRELAPDTIADEEALRLAAENAVLHCVLPTLDADQFVPALQALAAGTLAAAPTAADQVGGLLRSRVERLLEIAEAGFGIADAIDFWTALS